METIQEQEQPKCGEDNISHTLPEDTRICLADYLKKDEATYNAALKLNVPIVIFDNPLDLMYDSSYKNCFVLNDFNGEIYNEIYENQQRIMGPIALQQVAKEGFRVSNRPLYNYAMKGVFVGFTGLRNKSQLTRLVNYIHSMGGSIRKDMDSKVTHLISVAALGEKYHYSMTFRLPVVRPEWVFESWDNRDNIEFKSTNEEFTKGHKLKIFEGHRICFFGFPPDDLERMTQLLVNNGGTITNLEDPDCTHILICEYGNFQDNIPNMSPRTSPSSSSMEEPIKSISDNLNNENNLSPISNETSIELDKIDDICEDQKILTDLKRKRSFDIANESSEELNLKKQKFSRAGSIKQSFKRRMSSMSVRTPISNIIYGRRNSVDCSGCINSTFNETFKTPITNRLRDFCGRFTSNNNQTEIMTPKTSKNNLKERAKNILTPKKYSNKLENDLNNIKNPLPPSPIKFPNNPIHGRLSNQFLSKAAWTNKLEDTHENCMDEVNRVVDENLVLALPERKNPKTYILKSEWFWYTIQNGFADELEYSFGDYLDSIANDGRRESVSINFNKRKRKRFSQRFQIEGTPLSSGKRRSSISDAGLLSISGSFLNSTISPDVNDSASEQAINVVPKSMRYNYFMDFYNTESNYVGILETIVNLFKIPLEEKAGSGDDELINKSQIKAIFGNFTPIYKVHKKMLENLQKIQLNWSEDCLIGDIIMQQRNQLTKAYPPYVNYFEKMKETLTQCDTINSRFHAFLKINQAKPECGRQSLQDLMIRPVQRLPSVSLLLNDILKNTNKTCPDYCKLEKALVSIKEVMNHINEDKRKTENQLAIFDIFNDIEGCPPDLVSSHRSFISKCEVTEISDSLSGRGDTLVLYLFSDTIEICKRRSKGGFNSAKSPSSIKTIKHKHLKLLPLSSIKYVIEICDSPKGFAFSCRQNIGLQEILYSFVIIDEEIDRCIYLKRICKQIAENACCPDKTFISLTSQEIDVDVNDVNLSTLSKAFKFASRTRLKVGRAFSFTKTPSKLKRAVSTIMPSPFGSTNFLTPSSHISSHIANMRLASCTNINEVGEEIIDLTDDIEPDDTPVVQQRVQPSRKAKLAANSSTLRRI